MRLMRMPLPLLLFLVQLPLIVNPGYLSHDELEWLARADVPSSALPWVSWLDLSPLQYRPLTFNLWLVLAHPLGTSPMLMHGVFVLIGTINAWLLARVIAGMHVSDRVAGVGALAFALCPYAVYVHGWTGALADLLTLFFGLVAVRCMQRAIATTNSTAMALNTAAAALCAIALLCKESAVVLPALLALAVWRRPWPRSPLAAIAVSAAVAIGYVAMRPALAQSAELDPAYAWSIRNVPVRFVEYALFPFTPPLFEIGPLLSKSAPRLAAAAVCVFVLLAALGTAGWRRPIIWLIAFALALGPVLLLPVAYDHYAYLAAAAAVTVCAIAWGFLTPWARCAILVLGAIVAVHGIMVMARLYEVGVVQRNLCNDLVVELSTTSAPLHITAADPRDAWLIGRLLRDVESYRGEPFSGRVHFGDATAGDDRRLQMNRDGHLRPAGPSLTPD